MIESTDLPKKHASKELGSRSPKITLLIPTWNEEGNLPHVLPRIPPVVDEVLLVDGHSTDRTMALARELRPDIRLLSQEGKGKGDAIKCGVRHATGDIVVIVDADVSMDPEEIPRFIEPLLNGYDFVKGSRFLPYGGTADMAAYRKFGNRVFLFLVNQLFGGKYTDITYGYIAFWRDVFQSLEATSNGFQMEVELNIKVIKAGLRVTEVPSYEERRLYGKSNLRSFRDGMHILMTILRLRFSNTCRVRGIRSMHEN